MASITVPLSPWTSGKHRQEIAEAESTVDAAKATRLAVTNTVRQEIRAAHARVEAAMSSLRLYREGFLTQTELGFQSALRSYETGRADFLTVLEAERAVRQTRLNHYQTQSDLVQSLAMLERAIGKEFTNTPKGEMGK